MEPINVSDFEKIAKTKLEKSVYDYFASGACDELTLKRNSFAFNNILLLPRVLRGTVDVKTEITLFEKKLAMPIFIAPSAFHCAAHPLGEIATVTAANQSGIGMALSTMSTTSLEDVAAVATCPLWFQLYVYKNRSISKELIVRAEAAGYQAIVLTIDAPIMGKRENDIRNGFKLPAGLVAKNLINNGFTASANLDPGSTIKNYTDEMFDKSLSWHDIEWIRSITTLPIILKGIMHEEDAALALQMQIDGIIVSNHGGRQLDGMPATIDVLSGIAAQLQGKIPLLLDGGITRGTDIFKAIALGADCVMVGRSVLWALAVNGADGVNDLFKIYQKELSEAMTLCGCETIKDIRLQGKTIVKKNYY